ncbi:MAG TPA: host attachment protein [Caldimonas sp.]|jgi:hypothetical protein|nr:host attachment protein [Caldimonas sp.]
MEFPIWFVVVDADRARILELPEAGAEPRPVDVLTDPLAVAVAPLSDAEAKRFASHIADYLERAYDEARFEALRIAAAPRFLERLHAEIDKHIDLHRAELDWLAKDLSALEPKEAIRQMRPGPNGQRRPAAAGPLRKGSGP